MLSSLKQDLRFTFRQLWNNPGFTAIVVLTLAVGIGANTAIFSIVEGVLFAPLHYRDSERLVMIWETNPRFPTVWNSYPNFQDWQRSSRSFEQMAARREQGVDLTSPGAPSHIKAAQISTDFFSTLGVPLALGREFTSDEDRRGGTPSAVIGNRFWKDRFQRNADVLNKIITVDGVNYSIVGVAPANFHFEDDVDIYTPLAQLDPLILNNRATHDGLSTIARLKPGVRVSDSQADLSALQNQLDHLYPTDNRDLGVYVQPLKQAVVGDVGKTLMLLFGAVGLVLLIACANVSNVLLSRSTARSREFATRTALGASRSRIVQQVLVENLVLAMAGACVGIVIAFLTLQFILPAASEVLPRSTEVALNFPILAYTLIISLAVGVLVGLVPAFKTSNIDPQTSLRGRGRSAPIAERRVQNSLIFFQVGSTLVLLVVAGLLFRTIMQLWNVNPGFDAEHVITLKVGVPHSLTNTVSSTRAAYRQVIEEIRQIPGVEAAEFSTALPLTDQSGYLPFWLDSKKPESLQGAPRLQSFLTGPDYLRALRIPLLSGRFIAENDTTKTTCIAAIDTELAHKFLPDQNPIGHTITAGFAAFGPCTIVGVVGHVKAASLNDEALSHQYQTYYALSQDPDQWVSVNYPDASVVIRTPLNSASVISAIKTAVALQGNEQPIYDVKTMHEIASASMTEQRFPMILLGAFAGLSLLLASVGLYGVISYSVTQRIQEIGVRIAIGADQAHILRMIIWQQLRLVLAGILAGALGALVVTRTLSSFSHLLYRVQASDPPTLSLSALVLVCAALLASYIPARRATKVDPIVALRYE
jgi:predicted permease